MRIVITGATGFVGHALVMRLLGEGHDVTALTRSPARARERLGAGPQIERLDDDAATLATIIEGADAVVHLAGEPVAGRRWSGAVKRALYDSRVTLARRLVAAMRMCTARPGVFVSSSAVGVYGSRGSAELDEQSVAGTDFLAQLCVDWEEAALQANELGVRVAIPRTGLVLGSGGGVMAKMMPLFQRGVGGRIGSGKHFMAWIHLADHIELLCAALTDDRWQGAFNATAPTPVTNAEFTKQLAAVLGVPALLPVPAVGLRLAFGEGAQPLLASQRAMPMMARARGFKFRFERLEDALADLAEEDPSVQITRARRLDVAHSPYLQARGVAWELRQTLRIDAPIDEVTPFFSSAENLGAITPPRMSFEIQTPLPIEMREGALIDYRIKLGPTPMGWQTRIDAWEPGKRFIDVQMRGPYRAWWHEHRFESDGETTVMHDRVLYKPPLGPLGALAHWLFIRSMLRQIFSHRRHVISQRFPAKRRRRGSGTDTPRATWRPAA